MSEDISDKIDNDEWEEGSPKFFECPDGVKRQFNCQSGGGYAQWTGGWEHSETGQIYGISSWGKRKWRRDQQQKLVTKDSILDAVPTDGFVTLKVDITTQPLKHEMQEQMCWWFEQKDIDTTKLVPIKFRWDNSHGAAYRLKNGPQQGEQVYEPIPACIPRGYYEGILEKEYLSGSITEVLTKTEYVTETDVTDIVMIPTGGN